MGKPKGKKSRQAGDFSDSGDDLDPLAQPAEQAEVSKPAAGKRGKKGKKKKGDDWDDDDATAELDALSLENKKHQLNGDDEDSEDDEVPAARVKSKKKDKKKKKQVDSEDEDDDFMEEIPKKSKGKAKPAAAKASFALLGMDDSDEDLDKSSGGEQSEEEIKPVQKKKQKKPKTQDSIEDDDMMDNFEEKEETQQKAESQNQKKKGKKDKKKKNKADDEDIDAIMAEIEGKTAPDKGVDFKDMASMTQDEIAAQMEAEYSDDDDKKKKKKDKKKKKNKGDDEDIDAIMAEIERKTAPDKGVDFKDMASMTPDEIAAQMEAEYSDDDDKKKKKKDKKKGGKKQQQSSEDPVTDEAKNEDGKEDEGEEEEDEEESTVKTAAQKKKEKRERQKQKKLEEKAKASKKGKKQDSEDKEDENKEESGTSHEATPAPEGEKEGEEEDEEDSKKKKKKDKKKKGEKEEPKKKSSKMAKFILEQQQRIKEEEERIRKQEEEEERKIEEARAAKEEKERLEKERKLKKKQKEQERIERQKKEGKFMTAKQKEEQRITLAKLQALGIQVPDASEKAATDNKKKRIVYDNKKKKKQLETQKSQETKADAEPKQEQIVETVKEEVKKDAPETQKSTEDDDDAKDTWDAESEDDTKDAWDVESEEEEEAPKVESSKMKVVAKKVEKEEEEDEDDDEEDDDESDEDSSEEESSEEESSSEEDERTEKEKSRDRALRRIAKRKQDAQKEISTDHLRAAVVCVLGHVDTGKTKILDKLRRTNVQDNEAGGITQQIGATNVPVTAIEQQTRMVKDFTKKELKLPGLLIIDTPGHESFSNLRTRGSSLCDIAILVVDIMHGLEPQTIESINLLKARKCPFVVALNKIDRLYQWQSNPHTDIVNQLKKQKPNTKLEFQERVDQVKLQFAEQALNVSLFHENPNPKEYISLVPTSAHSGDGMGNLIALICELTQQHLAKKVAFSPLLQATVMEVKAIPGLGTTIDVIVVNGNLHEGQTIVVPGAEGPIVTQIRGLLLPQPMKELRVKGAYDHVKELKAAQGVKIIGKDLEKALAGLPLHVAYEPDEIDVYREELNEALEEVLDSIKLQERGVFVQASTLGSLEALLQFLKDSKIPYAGINIGPVHRKDVMKASVMLERDVQYACILAFDVKVEREAQEMADSMNIRIFTAEIIYHLFDAFTKYREEYKKKKQEQFKHVAVFPCKLRVLPQYIFNSRDPIVMGVIIDSGFCKIGTPICVPSKEFCYLGIVTSLEMNHKQIDKATKGQEVCVKIENVPGETPKLYGRHFDENDLLISKISRDSIDAVKNYFRDDMTKADWQLTIELKKIFDII